MDVAVQFIGGSLLAQTFRKHRHGSTLARRTSDRVQSARMAADRARRVSYSICHVMPRCLIYAAVSDSKSYMAQIPDPWHYPRPGLAQALLDGLGLGLTSARGVFASRRMGKTEFLLQDLIPAAKASGVLIAYANLWDNRADPAAALLGAIADAIKPGLLARLWRDLNRPLRSVKASGKIPAMGEASIEANLADECLESEAALCAVLRELDRSGKVLLLVIDEAQVLAQAKH
jgi:hypothetical protein